nr:MAG: hypothetical protein [Bacteriophage sp.]UVX76369.1 MAG: hypothetical protein [Bacteriophage sp.]UWG28527.1 MAG: hypothetical protein [Bacteriophage sp.]
MVELGVIVVVVSVEMGVEIVMLKELVLLVIFLLPNFFLNLLFPIYLNLLPNLPLILIISLS